MVSTKLENQLISVYKQCILEKNETARIAVYRIFAAETGQLIDTVIKQKSEKKATKK